MSSLGQAIVTHSIAQKRAALAALLVRLVVPVHASTAAATAVVLPGGYGPEIPESAAVARGCEGAHWRYRPWHLARCVAAGTAVLCCVSPSGSASGLDVQHRHCAKSTPGLLCAAEERLILLAAEHMRAVAGPMPRLLGAHRGMCLLVFLPAS